MKQNFLQKILISFIITIFLVLSFSAKMFAQLDEIDSEILVYFLPDSLEMDTGVTELDDITKLKIKSKSLDKEIKKIELKSIKKAFPEFDETDIIKTRQDGKVIKLPNMSRIFKLKLKNKDEIENVIETLSKEKGVLFAEPHSNMTLNTNDSRYSEQWHLNNTGQSGGNSNADIDAPEAWSVFTGSSSVKIGIMDSGVEITHDDLSGKSSGDLPESFPYDGYAHGTHVAGITAAKHGNIGQVKGVDANAQILSKKVFSGYIYDPYYQQYYPKWAGDVNAYNKIVDAVNAGIDVFNNSYGGPTYSTTLRMAFAYAYKNNASAIVSMGNDNGSQTQYPAGFGQGIITVGATDHDDNTASYSNIGSHIDVSAPGGDGSPGSTEVILSTWRGNSYHSIDGTSMAAPVVTGIASLLKGYNNYLYNDDIENIIRLAVDDVNISSYPGWDQYLGTGRVNEKKALDYLRSPYSVNHGQNNGGNIVSSTWDNYQTFYGLQDPDLQDGTYIVERHTVEKTIYFSQDFNKHQMFGVEV